MFDPGSPWNEAGIHGLHQAREWDVVASAEAQGLPGDEVNFTALPNGSLLFEEDVPAGALAPLAHAVEASVEPPYRARAVRRAGDVWAVAAVGIEVVELPHDFAGEELELVDRGGRRALHVDGMPVFDVPRELDALGAKHGGDRVVRARRLDATHWAAEADPL